MQSTYERFANRLSAEQRRVLNLVVNYQLSKGEQAPGRYIRVSFGVEDEGHVRSALQSLVPDYLDTQGTDPSDSYRVTPVGLQFSDHGPRASKLIEDVLQFFRARLSQNPLFSSYSWEDLKEVAIASDDEEFALVLLTLHAMRLTGAGSSTTGPPPGFSYALPHDIERLRRVHTFDELLQIRTLALEEERRRMASASSIFGPRFAHFFDGAPYEQPSAIHVHGDVLVGAKYTSNINGSTVGAVAVGDTATATGTVTHHGTLTQVLHDAHIKKARKALVDDEDQLDDLVHDALSQFLRLAGKIQVEQQGLAETQARMRATLDEVWATQVVKGMRPQVLPSTLEVVKALMENPAMGEVIKKLVGG